MTGEWHEKLAEMKSLGQPFAVATVISVRGSASAKPGAKAILDANGRNVWGWVGGGCAESFVGREAVAAMQERRVRIVQADLDDEIFGLGMPCGGVMDVFIDPQLPPVSLTLDHFGALNPALQHLARGLNFDLHFTAHSAEPSLEQGILSLAQALATQRGVEPQALRATRGVFASAAQVDIARWPSTPQILLMGNSRITEELARFAAILKWPVRVYGPGLDHNLYPSAVELESAAPDYSNLRVDPQSVVIVASHHKGDATFIRVALAAQAVYVGLIASPKRAGLVFEYLRSEGVLAAELARVQAPAGLELSCQTPAEIALSCMAQLVALKRGVGGA